MAARAPINPRHRLALLLVDVNRSFFDTDGPFHYPGALDNLGPLHQLLEAARDGKRLIVHAREAHRKGLLDYERLYRKRDLSHDELSLLREHVVVGAALVEPVLGNDVARAVLCHHERADGSFAQDGVRIERKHIGRRRRRDALVARMGEAAVADVGDQPDLRKLALHHLGRAEH